VFYEKGYFTQKFKLLFTDSHVITDLHSVYIHRTQRSFLKNLPSYIT